MDWYGCQKTRRRKPRISMRTNRREKDVRRLDRRLMRILEGTYPWCDGQNCKEEIPKEKSCSELQWRWSFSARTCIRVYGAECIGHEFNLAEGENTSSTISLKVPGLFKCRNKSRFWIENLHFCVDYPVTLQNGTFEQLVTKSTTLLQPFFFCFLSSKYLFMTQ